MKKILKVCFIFMYLIIFVQTIAFAETDSSYTTIKERIGPILNAIAWIGYAIALGMIIYIGIKYTMAAANEKANLKQGVINYLIGAFLIIGAATVSNIVSSIAMNGASSNATGLAGEIIKTATEAAKK